jgi:amidohydrolase
MTPGGHSGSTRRPRRGPPTRSGELAAAGRRLLQALARRRSEIVSVCRRLYADPEQSGEEHRASRFLAGRLESAGFRIERGAGGLPTAFDARLRNGAGGRAAILVEYDALPGVGHGCGHNLIAASGLGAALALAERRADWRGTLEVIGTPAEETFGGKAVMAEAGVFDGLDAALMVHAGYEDRVLTDSLACASFELVFRGRAAHAVSAPEHGINALDALVQVYVGMEMLRKSLGHGVHIPGVIVQGGVRPNLVPERAVGRFSVRAPTHARRREVHRRVVRLIEGVARATGARFSLRPTDRPYLEMRTNRALAEAARRHFARLGRPVNDAPRRAMGSLDMGNVSHRAPALHLYVSLGPGAPPPHTREFARATLGPGGRRAALAGAQILALTTLDVLTRADLRRRARAEWRAARREG